MDPKSVVFCFLISLFVHFVSGFSAVLPGFPRYSVVGDARTGVFNLRILNATLDDDAEYQCQVGPIGAHKAIRANAKLSVICKLLLFKLLLLSCFLYGYNFYFDVELIFYLIYT